MIAHSISMAGVDSSVPHAVLLALRAQRASEHRSPSLLRSLGAGAVAGGVGAVVGVGGGVIASPILRMGGMEQKRASATVLPMVLCSAAVAATTWYLNTPEGVGPDVMGGLVIGGVASFASPLGVKLSVTLPGNVVARALGVFMTGMGLFMGVSLYQDVLTADRQETVAAIATAPSVGLTETKERLAITAGLGLITGLAGGAFGVGGGVLLVPVLSQMTDVQTAAATSLTAILAPTLVSTLVVARKGLVVWRVCVPLLLAASAASFVSARVAATQLSKREQKGAFVAVMTLLGGRMLLFR